MKILGLCIGIMLVFPLYAQADAWWGEGYKKPDWVLRHGGTIIEYKISGAKKKSGRYKAVMYRNGKYVEAEFGKQAKFDDAKKGVYQIQVIRCDDECSQDKKHKKHKGDKKLLGTTVTAHPGETIRLVFNVKNKTVQKNSSYKYFSPPAPKIQYGLKRKNVLELTKEDIESIQGDHLSTRFSCTLSYQIYQLPILNQALESEYATCRYLQKTHLLPGGAQCLGK